MRILVYTPSDQPSTTGREALDRHKNIMTALKEYNPLDHKCFEKKSIEEKNESLNEWDEIGNVIIAHLTDIHPNRGGILTKMLLIEKAIGVFHCYDYPIKNDEIVEKLKIKKNIIFANSVKVTNNIKDFVDELNNNGTLKSATLKLLGKDEVLEKLLKPFQTASPINNSQWELELNHSKIKLNDYLQTNK